MGKRSRNRILAVVVVGTLTVAASAEAFSIQRWSRSRPGLADRWAPEFGLADGIQVGVAPNFAESLGAEDAAEVALIEGAVITAFEAWENAALRFDITFDATNVTADPETGNEIDLYTIRDNGSVLFGAAELDRNFMERTLTNGTGPIEGDTILGADIYLNLAMIFIVDILFPSDDLRIAALTRLMMHEIGHAIGLQHPGSPRNLDTNRAPNDRMIIDPLDPERDLRESPLLTADAVMTVRPCGDEIVNCAPLLYTRLTNDDLGGRDVLYPVVPEPSPTAMLGVVSLWWMGFGRRRRGSRRMPGCASGAAASSLG